MLTKQARLSPGVQGPLYLQPSSLHCLIRWKFCHTQANDQIIPPHPKKKEKTYIHVTKWLNCPCPNPRGSLEQPKSSSYLADAISYNWALAPKLTGERGYRRSGAGGGNRRRVLLIRLRRLYDHYAPSHSHCILRCFFSKWSSIVHYFRFCNMRLEFIHTFSCIRQRFIKFYITPHIILQQWDEIIYYGIKSW